MNQQLSHHTSTPETPVNANPSNVTIDSSKMTSSKWSNPTRSVFFGNLSYFCTAEDLRNICQPFGEIKKSHICRSPNGNSLFYGFVEFEDIVNADDGVQALHNKLFMGRFLRYVVQYSFFYISEVSF